MYTVFRSRCYPLRLTKSISIVVVTLLKLCTRSIRVNGVGGWGEKPKPPGVIIGYLQQQQTCDCFCVAAAAHIKIYVSLKDYK